LAFLPEILAVVYRDRLLKPADQLEQDEIEFRAVRAAARRRLGTLKTGFAAHAFKKCLRIPRRTMLAAR
jgi:hypothetical protein